MADNRNFGLRALQEHCTHVDDCLSFARAVAALEHKEVPWLHYHHLFQNTHLALGA